MLSVQTFEGMSLVNARASIEHPLADEVSIAIGDGAMCHFPYSVELAFFKNGEWSQEILPELSGLHNGGVYAYVPLERFAEFLDRWRVR